MKNMAISSYFLTKGDKMVQSLYPKRQKELDRIALMIFLKGMAIIMALFIIAFNICKPTSIYLLI